MAVALRELGINLPRTICCDESLCTTTRCSAQLPLPDRIYWLFSDPVGPGLCRILHPTFAEFHFHALGCLNAWDLASPMSYPYMAPPPHRHRRLRSSASSEGPGVLSVLTSHHVLRTLRAPSSYPPLSSTGTSPP
jgi:hypothetical protein